MNKIILSIIIPLFFHSLIMAQKSPKSDETALEKGVNLVNEEKYEEALSFIHLAISTDKENAELYRLLGQVLEILDKTDEAVDAWNMCLTLTEDDELEKEAKLHLEALEK